MKLRVYRCKLIELIRMRYQIVNTRTKTLLNGGRCLTSTAYKPPDHYNMRLYYYTWVVAHIAYFLPCRGAVCMTAVF